MSIVEEILSRVPNRTHTLYCSGWDSLRLPDHGPRVSVIGAVAAAAAIHKNHDLHRPIRLPIQDPSINLHCQSYQDAKVQLWKHIGEATWGGVLWSWLCAAFPDAPHNDMLKIKEALTSSIFLCALAEINGITPMHLGLTRYEVYEEINPNGKKDNGEHLADFVCSTIGGGFVGAVDLHIFYRGIYALVEAVANEDVLLAISNAFRAQDLAIHGWTQMPPILPILPVVSVRSPEVCGRSGQTIDVQPLLKRRRVLSYHDLDQIPEGEPAAVVAVPSQQLSTVQIQMSIVGHLTRQSSGPAPQMKEVTMTIASADSDHRELVASSVKVSKNDSPTGQDARMAHIESSLPVHPVINSLRPVIRNSTQTQKNVRAVSIKKSHLGTSQRLGPGPRSINNKEDTSGTAYSKMAFEESTGAAANPKIDEIRVEKSGNVKAFHHNPTSVAALLRAKFATAEVETNARSSANKENA